VPHKDDWTYSVIVPSVHPWYSLLAIESYRRMHEWIRQALASLGVQAELALEPQREQAGQCFVGYEQFDVLVRGRKIAGAAQRRRRDGLLIQGSVQPGFLRVDRASWEQAMCETARVTENVCWSDLIPDAALCSRAAQLAKQKYSQLAYNQKR
jgi:lipoate-protein ligase A